VDTRSGQIASMDHDALLAHSWRHLDLFSGIGGFALACRMVGGIETVAFCEIEPFAQKVLAKNFPGVPIHGDIHTLKGTEYGTVELITGGYPCQPFSLAGERRGKEDHRHLWPELCRVVETARPRWCLFENVVGHITLGLDQVLSDLDSIGYACWATVIPACSIGAFQHRERVWICANAKREGLQGHFKKLRPSVRQSTSHAKPNDGMPDSWDALARHSGGLRGSDGLSVGMVRSEVKGYGNAIVPQVAAEILKAMMQADRHANAAGEVRRNAVTSTGLLADESKGGGR